MIRVKIVTHRAAADGFVDKPLGSQQALNLVAKLDEALLLRRRLRLAAAASGAGIPPIRASGGWLWPSRVAGGLDVYDAAGSIRHHVDLAGTVASSDDPRYPRMDERVVVTGFGASSSLDDEWE